MNETRFKRTSCLTNYNTLKLLAPSFLISKTKGPSGFQYVYAEYKNIGNKRRKKHIISLLDCLNDWLPMQS